MKDRSWENYWKNITEKGRDKLIHHMNYETYVAVAKEITRVGGKVLDVGCGVGCMYDYLKGVGVEYTGIDISKRSLSAFKEHHPEADMRCASCFDIPFSDDFFEIAFCIMFLEHLHPEEYPKAIREMARVSKRRVIVGWMRAPWSNPTLSILSGAPYFSNRYNIDEVKEILEGLEGFKSLRILKDIRLRMPESWWSKGERRELFKREVYVVELENKCPA